MAGVFLQKVDLHNYPLVIMSEYSQMAEIKGFSHFPPRFPHKKSEIFIELCKPYKIHNV